MLPQLCTEIPGPQSQELAHRLARVECQNVTYLAHDWPIFWQRAKGVNVWDADGNRYLDLTSAFGVAGLGHGAEPVVAAMQHQAGELLHAMGDVHPTELKVRLCERLSELTFERWGLGMAKTTLSNSGFEAVETALKTAYLATGKRGVISFRNGYHGLGYGSLMVGGFDKFRDPFAGQLPDFHHWLDFPKHEREMPAFESALAAVEVKDFGAVLVEPIQGRGGKVVPPEGFHQLLRDWCDEQGMVLIYDEIYTGFQRTGKWFACEHWEARPDLLCVGKALSSGYPISACVGRAALMDAWPKSPGEALHTSTFLGNPVACAMALAALEELRRFSVAERVLEQSFLWRERLENIDHPMIHEVRGRGLMIGVELRHSDSRPASDVAGQLLVGLLQRGIIALADAPEGHVLAITPPFGFADEEIHFVCDQIEDLLRHHA